ncbi:MAG TPA: TolC family protein, partial [Isosphaeraceae bacterium]
MTQTNRAPARAAGPGRPALDATLTLILALGAGAGCGREFFRNWADQDVTEAVFEKSRDPRWRIDMFSIEPPALSRHADPYDRDRPPAPPDDRAAEALSPVPQWPHHRLIVPVEGTGYADMLEAWLRQRPAPTRTETIPDSGPSAQPPPPSPPSEDATSPFGAEATTPGAATPESDRTGPNSGTNNPGTTPILPGGSDPPPAPPADRDAGPATGPPQARATPTNRQDLGVHLAALQLPTPADAAGDQPTTPGAEPRSLPLDVPVPEQPDPGRQVPTNPDLNLDPGLLEPAPEEGAGDLSAILNPGPITFDEAEASGLPRGSRPYVLNPEQALTLALINSPQYHFQLENVYLSGLGVTLQRFDFQPQFFAGLTPRTPPTGAGIIPQPNPGNSFLYRTRETGNPTSLLNIGTTAGFGKLLAYGTRIAGSFANQTIINFTGNGAPRTTTQSFLPLTIVQPFLRGGGRALTLEGLTQSERDLLYQVRNLARFRQQFMPNVLASQVQGGTIATGLGGGGNFLDIGGGAQLIDTSGGGNFQIGGGAGGGNTTSQNVGFLPVLLQLQTVENQAKNVAAFERILTVFRTLAESPASGVAPLDIIQIESQLYQSRQQYLTAVNNYRSQLDRYKIQLGLPPDVPLTLDRSLIQGFREVFNRIDRLRIKPETVIEAILQDLPKLEEVIIDGRPVLEWAEQTDRLEDLLLAGERVALENRLDLMNARAQLYDDWRQLAVRANLLKGIFDLSVTNQFQTPPTTNNPFGFNDQTKQFSLAFNAELPLVRLPERNGYIQAQINYQRRRRLLMNQEDNIKFSLRQQIRTLQITSRQYEFQRRNFRVSLQQNDQSLQNIVAPPASTGGAAGATGGGSNNQTLVLIN